LWVTPKDGRIVGGLNTGQAVSAYFVTFVCSVLGVLAVVEKKPNLNTEHTEGTERTEKCIVKARAYSIIPLGKK